MHFGARLRAALLQHAIERSTEREPSRRLRSDRTIELAAL
jgi:hypothetical protein